MLAAFVRHAEDAMRNFSVVTLEHRPITMSEAASVTEACDQMRDCRAGSVLVTGKGDQLVGIFTGRDAVCRVLAQRRDPSTTRLAEVMTPDPAMMSPDCSAFDALRIMSDGGFRHVPLVKNGRILGLLSRGDFKGLEQALDERECDLWEHLR
jgi:CBS domain-containing protein